MSSNSDRHIVMRGFLVTASTLEYTLIQHAHHLRMTQAHQIPMDKRDVPLVGKKSQL